MNQLPEPYRWLAEAARSATALDADDRYGEADHFWSEAEVPAVVQAWSAGRPLLVRGEAGCGKSQLARAVAKVLGLELLTEVIHPRFEARDLLYREDAVRRLAHAQLLSAAKGHAEVAAADAGWLEKQLDPARFIEHGVLWQAFTQAAPAAGGPKYPRAVVLIDEIDKADADVPNALLEVLGNRSFKVPTAEKVIRCEAHLPLIILTTNEDRELPPAFVRRCAVLNLSPDGNDEPAFIDWLIDRARTHRRLQPLAQGEDSPLAQAARQVWADRKAAAAQELPTVGLAELLDLMYSLLELSQGDAVRARALLDKISPYALVKNRELPQRRKPAARGDRPAD